jgi:probable rRNA maturation factor
MITIKNTQRKVPLDIDTIRQQVQKLLDVLGYSDFEIGIWFTNDKTIREYNCHFRGKDKPTDILSFAYWPTLKPGEQIKPTTEEDHNLGDLILSAEYIQKDAEKLGVSLEERLKLLLVHGICHLLGYDHISDKDYRQMRAKEEALLKHLAQG